VHYPPAGASSYSIGTALGLVFNKQATASSDLQTKLNAFFDAIKDDLANNAADADGLGTAKTDFGTTVSDLLGALDLQNRWYYLGSLTTPACNTKVGHNVLRQILPITDAQIQVIKDATLAAEGGDDTFYTAATGLGNYRVTLPVTTGKPVIITNSEEAEALAALGNPYMGGFIAFLVLFIITLIGLGIVCYLYVSAANKSTTGTGETEMSAKANES